LKKNINRPIIIFTTFWDANSLVKSRIVMVPSANKNKVLNIRLNVDDANKAANFSIYSIALSHPKINDKGLYPLALYTSLERLDFFCPTYNMLSRYKKDGAWDDYTRDYMAILKNRKEDISKWIKSLKKDHVYILCCWENTSTGANCHRRLVYDAFMKSKSIRENALLIYRDGSSIYKSKNPSLEVQQSLAPVSLQNVYSGRITEAPPPSFPF